MKSFLLFAACLAFTTAPLCAQNVNTAQHVTLAGLRANAGHGSFPAAAYAADGSLFLLYDQHDGIRVLKLSSDASQLLGETHLGSAGDAPIALALDPAGNLYLTGTSTSNGTLTGTSGTAFPTRADLTTNSFVARLSPDLTLQWLTFLGAGATSATAVIATADAAFVTGITFSSSFPVTPDGIQQAPALGSSQNGFVERLDSAGQLVYATYLTGAQGLTAPAAIAADAQDNAYITGYTSSPGFPTINALAPKLLDEDSGFLTALTPQGDGFLYSTYIPGSGITSMTLDHTTSQLVLTGNMSPGGFPLATALAPLTSATAYQSLVRIPLDGQSVATSSILLPAATSAVSIAPDDSTWITGSLSNTVPATLFPGASQPLGMMGDSFALHLTPSGTLDQTLRFGGQPVGPLSAATLTSALAPPAISPDSATVAFPGTLALSLPSSLAPSQRFDLPTVQTPSTTLPSTLRDVASACTSGTCYLTSGYLTLTQNTAAPTLALSYDDTPNLTLRNLGSSTADALTLTASGPTIATNCTQTLLSSNTCSIALSGSGQGSFTASAANAVTETIPLPANTLAPRGLAVSPAELDFGLLTAADTPATRTFTVTNLSSSPQTFTSAQDTSAKTLPYTLTQSSTDCTSSGAGQYTLPANTTCRISLSLTATTNTAFRTAWKAGPLDITLTGATQLAALSTSTNHINFGTQISGNLSLPRYLHLSNNSTTSIPHATIKLPASSPFTLQDDCPSILLPHSICRLTLHYAPVTTPSSDAITLTLDQGLTVAVTGKILPAQAATGASANPALTVSPTSSTFTTPVVVTGISTTTQAITLHNSGSAAIPLTLTSTPEFPLTNGCPSNLTAGSSCTVLAAFAPSQPGTRQGLLSIISGSNFSPTYVSFSGTATPLLPANNGTLSLGQTLTGEPLVAWYKLQQPLTTLTVTSNSPAFSVALVEDTGSGHGDLPPASFNSSITSSCTNCWLAIQFLSQASSFQAATITLISAPQGSSYSLTATATALPVTGLLLTPLAQDFGPVAVHSTSAPQLFSLTNLVSPASAVSIASAIATGDFTVVPPPNSGPACIGTLSSGDTCYLGIAFSPTATAARTGTLTLTTSTGTAASALSGFGASDPGLSLQPSALNFRNVPTAAATQQTITVTNTSNFTLNLTNLASSDPAFIPSTNCAALAPAASCTITVLFHPNTSLVYASLTFTTTALVNGQTIASPYTIPLAGLYTAEDTGLVFYPDITNFGTLPTGSISNGRILTITNITAKNLNLNLIIPREFALTSPTPCPTLAPDTSCQVPVAYLPSDGGSTTGTLFAQATPTDGSSPISALAYLQGFASATGSLAITSPALIPHAPISFGAPPSGQSTQQTLTLTNNGLTPVTIRRILTDPPFSAATTCGSALAPNTACTVTITYAPNFQATTLASRTDTGTLTLLSDAASSPDTFSLTGTVQAALGSSTSNGAVISAYALSQGSLTFPNTQPGNASPSQTVTLTNTGSVPLHVLNTIVPTDFAATTTCDTLLPGDTCTYTVSFRPGLSSTATTRTGALGILTDISTALHFISLLGTSAAPQITLSPSTLNFGTASVGASSTLPVTVTNNSTFPIALTSVTATGDFSATPGNCPAPLSAGASCTLQITFAPTATGPRTGSLSISTDATTLPLTASLTGTAVQSHLQVTPGALSFGVISVGASAQLSLQLTNTGTAPVHAITATIAGTNPAAFAVTTPCPATLAPNQACTLVVTFTPPAVGPFAANLSLASDDPTSPAIIPLTGAGSAPGSFTLTVDGGPSSTHTVPSGSPATYTLTVTPINGFTGTVVLTCAPIRPGTYAACSLDPSTITLNGSAPATSTVTISTISHAGLTPLRRAPIYLALIALPLLAVRRRPARALALALIATLVTACGGHSNSGGGDNGIHYTPTGSYQYSVTATSTTGTQITQTVTLNLNVQ